MRIPKRYGESKKQTCTFCDQQATMLNKQKILVCPHHKDKTLDDIKCLCGSYLELKHGKFGAYFHCINCGNINFDKGLEYRSHTKQKVKVNALSKKDPLVSDSGKYPDFDYGLY